MTYAIISTRTAATMLTLTFDDGRIKQVTFGASLTDEQLAYLFNNIPFNEENLKAMCHNSGGKLKYEVLPTDLSFDAFWTAYAYKVGEKPKCIKLWNALTDVERLDALNAIKKYDKFLHLKQTAKIYPERFLSKKYWENEF